MSYDLSGYGLLNAGGYNPYSMNLTNSLYMMSFYDQLKNYYAGSAAKTQNTAGSGTAGTGDANFQTAFQEAFRKALQETMGTADNGTAASQAASGTGKTATKALSDRTVSARSAYQAMSGYNRHPSRIWTSSFADR